MGGKPGRESGKGGTSMYVDTISVRKIGRGHETMMMRGGGGNEHEHEHERTRKIKMRRGGSISKEYNIVLYAYIHTHTPKHMCLTENEKQTVIMFR